MYLNIYSSSDRDLAPELLPDSASTNKDRENVNFGCRRQNSFRVGGLPMSWVLYEFPFKFLNNITLF